MGRATAPRGASSDVEGTGGAGRLDDTATAGVSDEELLLAVAGGDVAAFEALYDRVAAHVYGVVRAVVRDPAQSEEVTQEVLTEVWRTAPRFQPERGSARTWLLTMAHRRAIDRVRSEQASRDRTDRVGPRYLTPDHDVVSDEVHIRLEHEEVRQALEVLSDDQREAIELAYFGGLTYREVADRVGAPLGTIKGRMRDGFHRLRRTLEVTR